MKNCRVYIKRVGSLRLTKWGKTQLWLSQRAANDDLSDLEGKQHRGCKDLSLKGKLENVRKNPAMQSIKTLKINEKHHPVLQKEYKKSLFYSWQNPICQAKWYCPSGQPKECLRTQSFGPARGNSNTQNIAFGRFGKGLCLDLFSKSYDFCPVFLFSPVWLIWL